MRFHLGVSSVSHLLLIFAYLLLISYYMYGEIRALIQWKCHSWSYLQWSLIVCSWTALGFYIARYLEVVRIETFFRQTHRKVFIDLQFLCSLDSTLNNLLGFCCFFASLKLLSFSRYARRLSIYGDALRSAAKDLLCVTCLFLVIFTAFLVLFYLLFGLKSLLYTTQMLVKLILLKLDATTLAAVNSELGPFSLALFIFFVVFVGMSMFVSIISASFRTARQRAEVNPKEDSEIFTLLWNRFQGWTGLLRCPFLFGIGSTLMISIF